MSIAVLALLACLVLIVFAIVPKGTQFAFENEIAMGIIGGNRIILMCGRPDIFVGWSDYF